LTCGCLRPLKLTVSVLGPSLCERDALLYLLEDLALLLIDLKGCLQNLFCLFQLQRAKS
jgi:hypothetical protein